MKNWGVKTLSLEIEYNQFKSLKFENKILQEEMSAIGARSPLGSFGIWMLGPALLEFATEEQKKELELKRKAKEQKQLGVKLLGFYPDTRKLKFMEHRT